MKSARKLGVTSLHSAGVVPGAPDPRIDVSMAASVAAPSSDSWAAPCVLW